MDDLISRQAAIDKIHEHMEITKQQASGEIRDDDVQLYIALHIAEEFIKTIPSAEPERKKGRIVNPTPYGECSECGFLIDSRDGYNFCPNCGADMRENDGETEGH